MKIMLASPGPPQDPQTWSGTPFGLMQGFQSLGHEVVPVDVAPPARVGSLAVRVIKAGVGNLSSDVASQVARLTTSYAQLFSLIGNAAIQRHQPDLIVQTGSGYLLRHRRVVTFEDMTIPQALAHGWDEGWRSAPPRVISRRLGLSQRVYEQALFSATATSWARDSVIADFNIPARRVHTVGLGLNRPGTPASDKDWSRPRFLFVGNDWERKNGPLLLEAFQALRDRVPQAELHLVGKGRPDIQRPGVVDHGFLALGDSQAQSKLAELFARATCLVVPSQLEPAGLVYVEAGSHGLPSIGTLRGGASDMIGPGGILVEPTSAADLTEAMAHVSEPHVAAQLGRRAHEHAQQFTWQNVARRFLESVESLGSHHD